LYVSILFVEATVMALTVLQNLLIPKLDTYMDDYRLFQQDCTCPCFVSLMNMALVHGLIVVIQSRGRLRHLTYPPWTPFVGFS
jgi:hypothetical protein